MYKKKITDAKQAEERYKRTLNRKFKSLSKTEEIENKTENSFLVENECIVKTVTVSTQVGFDNCGDNNFIFLVYMKEIMFTLKRVFHFLFQLIWIVLLSWNIQIKLVV